MFGLGEEIRWNRMSAFFFRVQGGVRPFRSRYRLSLNVSLGL
jgi:hypothetical protein